MAEGTSGGQSGGWFGRVFLFSMTAVTVGVNMLVVYLLLAGPDRLWSCLPPFLAAVLLAAAGLSGGLVLSPQAPQPEAVKDLPEGPVARAESWGSGWGLVLSASSMVSVGFVLGVLGFSVWLVACVSIAGLAVAALGRRDATRLQRPSELRLTVHALEQWEPRWPKGDLRRRYRIGLHEARAVQPDEEAVETLRRMSHRARTTQ